ncbi:hypothetical protein J1N35_037185 [Gossypium stocksii]|uniref:Aminotransferase-like plant mobile domain-containing protein n=1 Tax=Gossypium stocksii TaxID=47602 RepID=A0A9D3UJ69_9ROSI|nr:hypothetical protein J1N35_037185 [Gossypium stocksii]
MRECTITLEDVALQLSLPVDGPIITGSAIVPSKVGLCQSLLGKVSDKFEGSRILMNWLKDNFNEFLEDLEYQMKEAITQYAQAYIMRLIGGILMPNKSCNLVHIRWLLHLVDFNEYGELS